MTNSMISLFASHSIDLFVLLFFFYHHTNHRRVPACWLSTWWMDLDRCQSPEPPTFLFFFIQNYYHVLCSCWVVVLFGVSVIVWLVRFRRFPRWWHLPRPPLSFPSCPFFLLFGHWTWSAHLLFWSRPSLSLLAVCPMLPRQHDVPSGNNWRRINKAIPLVADQQRDAQTDGGGGEYKIDCRPITIKEIEYCLFPLFRLYRPCWNASDG